MTSPPTLSQALAAIGANAAFATHFTIEADPQLYVEGLGAVPLPVSIHTAHRLCALAQPAHHGYKDQTRLDRRVRDTWEITASHLRFNAPQWAQTLAHALKRIAGELGLPPGAQLDAELHNLLVYAPGQFFTTHQDSEKSDGMLGTLVLTLPSSFSGGEFVVSHQGQTLRSRGSAKRLSLTAFYADCLHEVRSVKQGYRVVLTYNLVARDGVQTAPVSAEDIAALSAALRAFWRTPTMPRWQGDTDIDPPDRLVYLLDHQYTQSGLSWKRLKGADAARAAALRKAAEQLDAEIFLTLADVHETWSAEDDYRSFNHYWNSEQGEHEDDLTDATPPHPPVGELLDRDIELRHWIDAAGGILEHETSRVDDAELCFTRPSSDCTPFQSEYEGYTGNAGNTLDRWYHRAAIVMWPRERNFVIRAKQSPLWAIKQITSQLKSGDAAQARQRAQGLQAFWNASVRAGDEELFGATLTMSAQLDDARTSANLLAPFTLGQLTPKMAPWLLRLFERHGLNWCMERLRQWTDRYRDDNQQLQWLARTLPKLAHAWSAKAKDMAAALTQDRWAWLQKHLAQMQRYRSGGDRIQSLTSAAPSLLALLRASHEINDPKLHQAIITTLLSPALPLQMPLGVLHEAGAQATDAATLGLAPVHDYCLQALSARLAQPERPHDDWSIPPPDGGIHLGKELSKPMTQFLASPSQRRLEWPLAKENRQIIHQFIDRNELPIKHETRRNGRPYTLVLEKTWALFTQETAERQMWAKELAWLRGK